MMNGLLGRTILLPKTAETQGFFCLMEAGMALIGWASIYLIAAFFSIFGPSIVVQTLCHSANMKPHGLTHIFTILIITKFI